MSADERNHFFVFPPYFARRFNVWSSSRSDVDNFLEDLKNQDFSYFFLNKCNFDF